MSKMGWSIATKWHNIENGNILHEQVLIGALHKLRIRPLRLRSVRRNEVRGSWLLTSNLSFWWRTEYTHSGCSEIDTSINIITSACCRWFKTSTILSLFYSEEHYIITAECHQKHTNLTVVFVLAKRAATDVVAVVVLVFTGVVVFRLSRYKQR